MSADLPGAARKPGPRTIRVLGAVLVVIGAALVAAMAYALVTLAPGMERPGSLGPDGARFTGTAAQGAAAIRLFQAVLGFGVVSLVIGFVQLVTGRRPWWTFVLALPAVALLGLSIWQVNALFQ